MKNQIIPCYSVNGLVLGNCYLNDLLNSLGNPDSEFSTPKIEIAGVNYGEDKVVGYTDRGLFAIIDRENINDANPIIDEIYVEFPFDAVSKEGLYIGMNESEAKVILERNFYRKYKEDGAWEYSIDKAQEVNFEVSFEDNKLIRMEVIRLDTM